MLMELHLKVMTSDYCGNVKITVNLYGTQEQMLCSECNKTVNRYIASIISVFPLSGFETPEKKAEFQKLVTYQVQGIIREIPRCAATSAPDKKHEEYIKNLFYLNHKYNYISHTIQ
jgi:hypothetical protein